MTGMDLTSEIADAYSLFHVRNKTIRNLVLKNARNFNYV